MKIAVLALLVSVVGWSLHADDELATLKEQRKEAIERVLTPLNERYIEELETLMKFLTESAKLEEAVIVRDEIDRVEKEPLGISKAERNPERLELLSRQRATAMERALAPITSRYVQELERLLRVNTSAGNLDAALKIKEELAELDEGTKGSVKNPGEFSEATLIGTVWKYETGGNTDHFRFDEGELRVLKLNKDGSFTEGDSRPWELVDSRKREIRLHWHSGPTIGTFDHKISELENESRLFSRVEE